VARAARTRQGVISNDVTQEPDFLPNPLLPETKSEMALPMIVGSNLIGVLDVQSDQIGRFTKEDVRVMTTRHHRWQ
jgi:GAF domain-containing protein